MGVLTRDRLAEGWEWQIPAQPTWWERHSASIPSPAPQLGAPTKRPKASAPLQGNLFDTIPHHDVLPSQSHDADWIKLVLQSLVFATQRRLAGRNVPSHAKIAEFLQAFESHQYRLSRARLSQVLHQPEPRLHGLLTKLKTVFNVEGYPILIEDEATGTITFNRQLLDKQFQIR